MNFRDKVRSMKNYEIIEAMCNGLEKEHVRVNMNTFGRVQEGVCCGCAATNTICEISGIKLTPEMMDSHMWQRTVSDDVDFVVYFQLAIDHLRRGNIKEYNRFADKIKIASIPLYNLPFLDRDYKERLPAYRAYAKELRSESNHK